MGVSDFTVSTTWKKWGLQPWRSQTFKFSTDPEPESKIRDIVGLYLDPPEAAQTHDYVRHGTTTLFAALEVATGK